MIYKITEHRFDLPLYSDIKIEKVDKMGKEDMNLTLLYDEFIRYTTNLLKWAIEHGSRYKNIFINFEEVSDEMLTVLRIKFKNVYDTKGC